jgi:RNA polymerase sigma-70 factor (ECF subfamily)
MRRDGPGEACPPADARLLEQIRNGDADAGQRFVREYYPGVYRYLLYLTGRREQAEDLAQETFLQAWRHLDRLVLRAPLRAWLHRIAHREFLQALRSQRPESSLEELPEAAARETDDPIEAARLRAMIARLAPEERDVIVLHYLEGYSYQEIARIVDAPYTTVKYRLAEARAELQRALGEGDLPYLNPAPEAILRHWSWLPLEEMYALERRWGLAGGAAPLEEEMMERREFLRHAAAGAAGMMLPEAEKEVVDGRLTQKVTCAFKGTALADLCERLRLETGVRLAAGASVADEKVTVFCEKLPLRDVMRQLSRPFGYTWIRSGRAGDYRYELMQDLRSQLLEEELRNRDRVESLLALERDLERYRPYLGLTPDEALARSATATGPQKALFEAMAGPVWAGLQVYSRLSAQELAAMRAGQEVIYSGVPRSGERPLPPEVARGILQTMRERRLVPQEDGRYTYTPDATAPGAIAPAALPDASGRVHLRIVQSEVGRFALHAQVYYFTLVNGEPDYTGGASRTCGSGINTATRSPGNRQANASLAADPALRRPVTISLAPSSGGERPIGSLAPSAGSIANRGGSEASAAKITTADVLEAVHRATGWPVVGDHYTRLYAPETLAARNVPLFDALNRLADATRLRWRRESSWLQFRTTNYYDERLKEVPNRLLSRWADARRRQGMLTIEEVVEIAQLADAQLDAESMAEGAREQWGLVEWDLARQEMTRPHLRFLAGFTPAQRQEAMSATGLLFSRMSLAQQQRYLALGLTGGPLGSLEDLSGAMLRVEYTQPGWFQWGECGWSSRYTRWVVPLEFTPQGRRVPRPPVRERTRAATLQAIRRVDPALREALLAAACRADPRLPAAPHVVEEDEIVPTRLDLAFVYIPGSTNARPLFEVHPGVSGEVGPAE